MKEFVETNPKLTDMNIRCCDLCGLRDRKSTPIYRISAQRVPRPSINKPYIKVFSIDLCQNHIDYITELVEEEMVYKIRQAEKKRKNDC